MLRTRTTSRGFTIIEVMIVLVIAAVILLIVFLAVPALQRNSRNTQRNNEAGRLSTALINHLNSGGAYPGGTIGSNVGLSNQIAAEANIKQFNRVEMTGSALSISEQPASKDTAQFRVDRICNSSGSDVITGAPGNVAGRIALVYWLEPDTPRCMETR